jgi:hypothetical protein
MAGWLQTTQPKGRPSRNGPDIHNRYRMVVEQFVGLGLRRGGG